MQCFRTLRATALILVLALAAFGCATGKAQVASAEFGLTAEAAPEGILLTLSNIPPDATHLWIGVTSWGDAEVPDDHHSVVSSFAGITDDYVCGWVHSARQLDKVKQTGKVIFPVVQPGVKYFLSATVYNEHEMILFRENNEDFWPRTAHAEFTADNGIYFNRDDVKLEVNDAHSVVTLSSEPKFSSEVTFDDQKYSFGVTVIVDDSRSMGVGDHHFPEGLSRDGLTWVFEPQMTADMKSSNEDIGWLETGSYYPAWAKAYANIIYDDIKWCVEIAKTTEFKYSL